MRASSQERAERGAQRHVHAAWRGVLGALVAASLVLGWGCSDEAPREPSIDSETHWLRACDGPEDPSCGGLDCVCGVCTESCDAQDACAGFGEGAVCEAPDAEVLACGAAVASSARVCALECAQDADCAQLREGLVCAQGACVPSAFAPGDDVNNSSGGTNNGTNNNGTNNGTSNNASPDPNACGGDTGQTCADDARCVYPDADVCGLSAAGSCAPRPEVCTEEFTPVCGCDGVTYSNACRAEGAGTSVASDAPCPGDGNNGGPQTCIDNSDCSEGDFCARGDGCGEGLVPSEGLCVARPEFCTEEFNPVCGCDGVTYSNACNANEAGVNVQSTGACP